MESDPRCNGAPVQYTSLHIRVFGMRLWADGHTGWSAWKAIRKQHPKIAWLAAGYTVMLASIIVLGVLAQI
ncbi:hypothetical protein [Streptomyces afghaniensis]|uniref:hypothetical protein n=1 Tax=Streptomyces afghaniensis TaxID=66865 RepID=UPI002787D020|nr:hypothetical protein [Streptomyces afghaniensis]MDQ1019005.1 hypothetical protein [Streptomyces afghaniensis]